jgi:imidazolonepropionase-like amidohydrolase
MRRTDLGRLADGKMADVLVVEGNPLADIKIASRKENHRVVIKRGIVAKDARRNAMGAGQLFNAAAGL